MTSSIVKGAKRFERHVVSWLRAPPDSVGKPVLVAAESPRHVAVLQPYLQTAGFRVAAILTPEGVGASGIEWRLQGSLAGDQYREIPVVALSDYASTRETSDYSSLPIVVADMGDGAAFRSLAPRITALIGTEQRLLHPAFLADFLDHDLSHNVVTYGYPGSGNVIIQKIIATLLAPHRIGRFDQLESWCASGHILLCEILREALTKGGFSDVAIGYGQPGYLTLNAATAANRRPRLYLPRIPSKMWWAESVYGTHCPPQPGDLARIAGSGGHPVIVVRHPLDTIISMAAKHGTALLEQIMAEHKCSKAEARAKAVQMRLDDDEVFLPIVHELHVFSRAAAQLAPKMQVLRYEDLMADPVTFIDRLAGMLNVSVSHKTSAELAGLVGTANLGPADHFYNPVAGKWRRELSEEHLVKIERNGGLSFGEELGYSGPEFDRPGCGDPDESLSAMAISSFSHMYYLDDATVRESVRRHHVITEVGGLEVTSESSELIDEWKKITSADPYLVSVMRSMAF